MLTFCSTTHSQHNVTIRDHFLLYLAWHFNYQFPGKTFTCLTYNQASNASLYKGYLRLIKMQNVPCTVLYIRPLKSPEEKERPLPLPTVV